MLEFICGMLTFVALAAGQGADVYVLVNDPADYAANYSKCSPTVSLLDRACNIRTALDYCIQGTAPGVTCEIVFLKNMTVDVQDPTIVCYGPYFEAARSITIQGNGTVIKAGAVNAAGFLQVSALNRFTVRDIEIKDFKAQPAQYGLISSAAIAVWYTLEVLFENVIFRNNSAIEAGAAAHIATVDVVTIRDCVFDSNSAAVGGALYIANSEYEETIIISNCTFNSNSALLLPDPDPTGLGGAIYFEAGSQNIAIIDCIFSFNFAINTAGAIYFDEYVSDVVIMNCEFFSSVSDRAGAVFGALANYNFYVNNTRFISNEATGISGGAVNFADCRYVYFVKCYFEGNSAAYENGGGLVFSDAIDVYLLRCSFVDNHARRGGAVSFLSSNFLVFIAESYFGANSAEFHGGGVSFEYLNLYSAIYNCIFEGNNVLAVVPIGSGGGGAVGLLDQNYDITIINCSFVENYAMEGGAISAVSRNIYIEIINCTLRNNSAGNFGGGIFIYLANGGEFVQNNIFYGNTAGHSGGAIYYFDKNRWVEFYSNSFEINIALRDGGGIFFGAANDDIFISDSYFFKNGAGRNGGAVAVSYQNVNISFTNSVFVENEALQGGGAVYSVLGTVNMVVLNCVVYSNYANQGSGLYLGTNHIGVLVAQSDFSSNFGQLGTGVYVGEFNSDLEISDSSFEYNIAFDCSAAIYALSSGILIRNCQFEGQSERNLAAHCGTVSTAYSSGNVFMANTFVSNYGLGALQLFYTEGIIITDNYFESNIAAYNGAAIQIVQGKRIVAHGNTFVANIALTNGGALSLEKSREISVSNSLFLTNYGNSGSGGALHIETTSQVNITNCNFSLNAANMNAGAVNLVATDSVFLINNIYGNNTAVWGSGAAVHLVEAADTDFGNSVFSGNVALYGGGAVLWNHNIERGVTMPSGLEDGNNVFVQNHVAYGDKYATQGYKTKLYVLNEESGEFYEPVIMNNSSSNATYSLIVLLYGSPLPTLRIKVLDYYDNIVLNDNTSIVRVTVSPWGRHCGDEDPYITGDTVEDMHIGIAEFQYMEVHCIPGGMLDIDFETSYVSSTGSTSTFFSKLQLSFRTCVRGEFYENGDCTLCPEGSYSLAENADLSVTKCYPCPENTETCIGDDIEALKGFWRNNYNAATFLECLLVQDGCLGGWMSGDESCKIGYEGPLCSVCSANFFFNSAAYTCDSCDGISGADGNTFVAVITILAILLIVAAWLLYVRHTIHNQHMSRREQTTIDDVITAFLNNLRYVAGRKTAPIDLSAEERRDIHQARKELRRRLVVKFKIYLTLYQIISSLSYVLDFGFPDPVQATMSVLRVVNFSVSQGLSISCDAKYDYISVLLVTTTLPIGVSLIIFLAYRIHVAYLGDVNSADVSEDTSQSSVCGDARNLEVLLSVKATYIYFFLFFTYIIFPGVSTVIFQMFSCQNIDEDNTDAADNYYLRADYSISCQSGRYYFGVSWALVMLFVYPVGIPMFYFFLLNRAKNYITSRRLPEESLCTDGTRQAVLFPLAFLFEAYKPVFWYWEVVEAFQRLFFTGILVCVLPGTNAQVLVAVLFSLLFIKVYDVCSPFIDSFAGFSKNLAQWQYFGVFFIVLLLKSGIINDKNSGWAIVFFFLSLFANAIVDVFYLLVAMCGIMGPEALKGFWLRSPKGLKASSRPDDVVMDEVELSDVMRIVET